MKQMSQSSPEVNDRQNRMGSDSGSGGHAYYTKYNEEPITYNRDTFRYDIEIQEAENRDRTGENQPQQPGTPKLAKSAQEKLRKLKEEQQRASAGKQRENAPREDTEITSQSGSSVHSKQLRQSPRLNRKHSNSNSLRYSKSFTSGMRNNRNDEEHNTDQVDSVSPALPASSPTRPVDPDDRPIKPAKQQFWPDQNSNYEIDRQSSEYLNGDGMFNIFLCFIGLAVFSYL